MFLFKKGTSQLIVACCVMLGLFFLLLLFNLSHPLDMKRRPTIWYFLSWFVRCWIIYGSFLETSCKIISMVQLNFEYMARIFLNVFYVCRFFYVSTCMVLRWISINCTQLFLEKNPDINRRTQPFKNKRVHNSHTIIQVRRRSTPPRYESHKLHGHKSIFLV
jgi:hypothetical protein